MRTAVTGWQGLLELQFAAQDGATQLSRSTMQAPLKVQRPFFPEGDRVCHVVTLHTAGGVVGGDRLSTQVHLGSGAQALSTTATAGKIYRSNGHVAEQSTQIRVAAGACLEWLPQETIVFDGADYRQRLRVDLEDDALWLGWEITRLGRTARGETFASGQWRSHTEVWHDDTLIWVDPQQVRGGSATMTSAHGLGGCSVVASFALFGRRLNAIAPDLLTQVRQLIPIPPDANTPPLHYGITRLQSGLLCRYRGSSTLAARRWFTQVWHLLRPPLLGRPGCVPRVW